MYSTSTSPVSLLALSYMTVEGRETRSLVQASWPIIPALGSEGTQRDPLPTMNRKLNRELKCKVSVGYHSLCRVLSFGIAKGKDLLRVRTRCQETWEKQHSSVYSVTTSFVLTVSPLATFAEETLDMCSLFSSANVCTWTGCEHNATNQGHHRDTQFISMLLRDRRSPVIQSDTNRPTS